MDPRGIVLPSSSILQLRRTLNLPPSAPSTLESGLLATALDAAEAAADVHRRYLGRIPSGDVVSKGRSDFVSRVDLEAQDVALDLIRRRYPDHQILAEEDEDGHATGTRSSALDGQSSTQDDTPLWIVDPLDGTMNYLHGHPAHAASVGVSIGGEGVAGAVVASATGERWWAVRGQGAFHDGERIRTSSIRDPGGALVGTGFPFRRPHELPMFLEEFQRVFASCSGIRRLGSATLDLCYLAQGSLDAFWEGRLAPWDLAAGRVILQESGGVLTRKDGSPLQIDAAGSVLAANSPELHEALRRILNP